MEGRRKTGVLWAKAGVGFSLNEFQLGGTTMVEKWKDEAWAKDIWYRGKVTRRTLVGWGGGAIGAMMLVPAPWRAAFGAAKTL